MAESRSDVSLIKRVIIIFCISVMGAVMLFAAIFLNSCNIPEIMKDFKDGQSRAKIEVETPTQKQELGIGIDVKKQDKQEKK